MCPSTPRMAKPARSQSAQCELASVDNRAHLAAINKIDERTPHALERVSRFVLRMTETFPDPRSNSVKWRVLLFRFLLRIALRFYIAHFRAGKHSLGARDVAAIRADANRADRSRGLILQRDDPN